MTINIGDSRLYEIRRDEVLRLSGDQSVIQEKLDFGMITENEAKFDSDRNVLLQCVGGSTNPKPEVRRGELKKNSTLIACSDGFWRKLTEDEMHQKLCPQMCVSPEDMLAQCNKLSNLAIERKEEDNISVAVLCIEY